MSCCQQDLSRIWLPECILVGDGLDQATSACSTRRSLNVDVHSYAYLAGGNVILISGDDYGTVDYTPTAMVGDTDCKLTRFIFPVFLYHSS